MPEGTDFYEVAAVLGISSSDARAMAYLYRNGVSSAAQLARALDIHRSQAHRVLGRLEASAIVDVVAGRPTMFRPVPLEQLLEARLAELQLEQARLRALAANKGIAPTTTPAPSSGVNRLVGHRAIAQALARMAQEARATLLVRDGPALSQADLEGALNSPVYAGLADRGVEVTALLGPCAPSVVSALPGWARIRIAEQAEDVRYVVADGRVSLLWIDVAASPEERQAVFTQAPPVARLLGEHFRASWAEARRAATVA